jgi:endo-1,4-beta-xylanase
LGGTVTEAENAMASSQSKKLTRRDFLKLMGVAGGGLVLSACAPVSSPTSTPAPSATPLLTATTAPTSTATPTSTPTAMPTSTPTAPPTLRHPETLRDYADALDIEFGGGTAIGYFQDWQPEHNKIKPFFLQNFNLFQDGWDGLWTNPYNPLRPSKTDFDFSMMDLFVNFVRQNNLRSQILHLVWGHKVNIPDWLMKGSFTETELLDILQNHIQTVVSRYKGKVNEWSVVNEILGTPWENGNRFWYDHLDKKLDWVKKCFQWANEADPNAVLFLNDFGIEFPGFYIYDAKRDDFIYKLIRDMKEKGIPIHAVGFQMHLNASKNFVPEANIPLLMDALYRNIEKYRGLGIDVYVTEFDCVLSGLKGTLDDKYALQAKIYGSVLDTCLAAGVKSFTVFNLIDRLSWLESPENPPYSGKDADPCPWDDNYQPKPAYFAILDVMKRHYAQKVR